MQLECQRMASELSKELANMMDASRTTLTKALDELKSTRAATETSRTQVQNVINKIGARGDERPETTLWDAKQEITTHIEDLKALMEERRINLHDQVTKWAIERTSQLENQRQRLEVCIKNDDDAIRKCEEVPRVQ